MPANFSVFRSVPTNIKLNGPIISYTKQPDDTTESENRTITFDAVVQVRFDGTSSTASGSYSFKWYLNGVELEDPSSETTYGVSIINDGATSQLVISNVDKNFDGNEVYVVVTYVPSSDEGQLNNQDLKSDVVSIELLNDIEILTQPEDTTISEGLTAQIDVVARSVPVTDPQRITYQWQMASVDLSDGTISSSEFPQYGITSTSGSPKFTVTSDDGAESFVIDWSQTSSFGSFTPGKVYSIVSNQNISTKLTSQGAGGARSGERGVIGSSGGFATGYFDFLEGNTYKLVVGSAGKGGLRVYKDFSVSHTFDSTNNETTQLSYSSDMTVEVKSPESTPTDCTINYEWKYYTIIFAIPMVDTNYEVNFHGLSDSSADGSRGNFSVTDIRDKTVDGFNVWFCKSNPNNGSSVNDFISSFKFDLVGVRTQETIDGVGGIPGGGSNILESDTTTNQAGGGGGYTGLFLTSVSKDSTIMLVGGGGGSSSSGSIGGDGGAILSDNQSSSNGSDATIPWIYDTEASKQVYGRGATTSDGGSGGLPSYPTLKGVDGSELIGGNGNKEAGGGGAGYYGGGGGGYWNDSVMGGGGGGSSYINTSLVTSIGKNLTDKDYTPNTEKDGKFDVTYVGSVVSSEIVVSGSNTPSLSLYSNTSNIGSDIRCTMSSPKTLNVPLYSETVAYKVTDARPVLVIEAIDTINNWIVSSTSNLESSSFTLDSNTFGSTYKLIQFYSKENDFTLEMDIRASAGKSRDTHLGGQGGTSKIRLDIKKNVEYTTIGIAENSAVFIYEKARLIAVVGSGGDAGKNGAGGAGGGVNVDGIVGQGRNPGRGGVRPRSNTLTIDGVYGSSIQGSDIVTYDQDSIASIPDAGRTISCSKGLNYINQGLSPCVDISSDQINFVDENGVSYIQSSPLFRGFKAGYTITDTSGRAADLDGGNGGNGATGGAGGVTKSGGGGGSGYVDSSVSIVSTGSGGNVDTLSSIVFSVVS